MYEPGTPSVVRTVVRSFTPSHLTQILAVTLAILEAPLLMSHFIGEAPSFFHDHISEPLCVCYERWRTVTSGNYTKHQS